MDMAGNDTNVELSKMGVSSTPMLDSFCLPIWDLPTNMNHDPTTSSMGWIPNAMITPSLSMMLPHSLPPDSAFIQRAATFSCFKGGNFSENDEAKNGASDQEELVKRAEESHKRERMEQASQEYIHVRAPRGQATNTHSLAERIRREKISERMKLLQDLVPGCSKVTGKAVMLDEIINYVQSLQRQVEFLSMKLATVNPHLDFNVEGFLAKDMLQPTPFPLDVLSMPFPLHPGLNQVGLQGTRSSCHSTLYVPTSRHVQVWEDELHNAVHNGFNSSAPDSSDHTKAES